jgi:hypothetical protein
MKRFKENKVKNKMFRGESKKLKTKKNVIIDIQWMF